MAAQHRMTRPTKVLSLILFIQIGFSSLLSQAQTHDTEKMEKVLEKRPNQITIREQLGETYFKKKEYKKAIDTLAPYSNDISNDSMATLAQAYEKSGDNVNRLRMLQMYVEREPNKFRSNHLLGVAYKDLQKYNEAAEHLRKAMELAPKHKPSYDALLEIFIQEKNNYEARNLVQDMIKVFGPKSEFDTHMCRLLANDGFLDQAQKACQEAVKRDPKIPENHIYLAQVFYDQKNKTSAERVFKTAAGQFPKSEFVQYATGQYYFSEKNFSAAVRYLDAAVKLKSDSYRSHLVLAMALYESRNPQKALPHFDKACKLDKTKDAVKEFRTASAKLFKEGQVSMADQYDNAIALCSGP